jgi:hypothetical protein
LHRAPPGPVEASARRHRFTDIRVTRNPVATSRSLALSSIERSDDRATAVRLWQASAEPVGLT